MRSVIITLALLLCSVAVPALAAVDASDVTTNCDNISAASKNAQLAAIKAAIPDEDPGTTFSNTIDACLENIVNYDKFTFKMPSLADLQSMLKQLANELLQQACSAAVSKFNSLVSEATQEITSTVSDATYSTVKISTSGGTVSTTVSTSSAESEVKSTASSAVSDVINGN